MFTFSNFIVFYSFWMYCMVELKKNVFYFFILHVVQFRKIRSVPVKIRVHNRLQTRERHDRGYLILVSWYITDCCAQYDTVDNETLSMDYSLPLCFIIWCCYLVLQSADWHLQPRLFTGFDCLDIYQGWKRTVWSPIRLLVCQK